MKKTVSIILSLLFIISMFAGCTSQHADNDKKVLEPNGSETIEALYPSEKTVSIHSKKQNSYLNNKPSRISLYARGQKPLCKPEPVSFEWVYNGDVSGNNEYTLSLSENEDMKDAVHYTTSSESMTVTMPVYNLKIDTTYYWTVSDGSSTSSVCEFTTEAQAPRNMNVDGVKNVRDLGGWQTESGKRTKQGLIYRCGRLNESSADKPNIEITDEGIKTMCRELGIKSEIDLRKTRDGETGAINSSPLGNRVTYYSFPMEWEGDTFNENKQEILKVFELLSNPENYPVIFHCNIGTDRTGMIAYLLNALLGVSEEDLIRDYLFSNFADIGGLRNMNNLKKSVYYKSVHSAQGNSLSEKTYNCLLKFGVQRAQLDAIIDILSAD